MMNQTMMDDMDGDEASAPAAPASSASEICVPAGALEVGDTEQDKTAPEVGDDVEVKLGGKVTRVEGGSIYFKPTTANGEPIGEKESSEPSEESQMEADIAAAKGQPSDEYS
jgi:hypothetical protein